ncbi:unnamed protein product, partial [Brenthis ino]
MEVSSELSMRRMRSSVGGVPLGPRPAMLAILISYCGRRLKFAIGRPATQYTSTTVTPQLPSSRHVSRLLHSATTRDAICV